MFSKKKEENNSNTNVNQTTTKKTTITCTEIDNEDTSMVATLNDDKIVRIVQKQEVNFDSEEEAQLVYSDTATSFEMFNNVDGFSYSLDINDKKINLEWILEISKLKSFIDSNPDILETVDLNTLIIETEEEFKDYAAENNLRSCLRKEG